MTNDKQEIMLGRMMRMLATAPAETLGVLADLVARLTSKDGAERLEALKKFLRKEPCWIKGAAKTGKKTGKYIANLAITPFLPSGWQVAEHQPGPTEAKLENKDGQLYLNGKQVVLHLDESQQNRKTIQGHKLRERLKGQPTLNANLLDFLLQPENQHLIPDFCKDKYVFFWGTVYRGSDGGLCVRYLHWLGVWWDWDYYWLGFDWNAVAPAACLAPIK